MARTGNHGLPNVGRHMPHDLCLQRTERLLTPEGQERHRELYLLKDFVVLRILRERGKLRKPRPHSSRLRVGRREKVSGGFVGLAGISCEVIPYAVKIDSLTARDQPFRGRSISTSGRNNSRNSCCRRSMKVKMQIPNTGIEKYLHLGTHGITALR